MQKLVGAIYQTIMKLHMLSLQKDTRVSLHLNYLTVKPNKHEH